MIELIQYVFLGSFVITMCFLWFAWGLMIREYIRSEWPKRTGNDEA